MRLEIAFTAWPLDTRCPGFDVAILELRTELHVLRWATRAAMGASMPATD